MKKLNCSNIAKKILLPGLLVLASTALWAADVGTENANPQVKNHSLPGESVYQLPITLEDQQESKFKLADHSGKVTLVSMFYNSCEFVCPMLIDTIQLLEEKLSPDEQKKISTLLVTFDPDRDDVSSLQSIAKNKNLDAKKWILARTDAASVRQLAAVLDIQYRQMESGEFNHTSVIILLDEQGRILARSGELGMVDSEFLQKIKSAIKGSSF